jgi:hypothetical protein
MPLSMKPRRRRVGASEVSILTGTNPFKRSRADLFARIAYGIEQPRRPIMDMGNLMEGGIFWLGRQVMRDRGLWCRRNTVTTVRDRYVATPDGYCQCGGVIEVKNVSGWAREHWLDGATPPWYVDQVQCQMMATGRDHAHVWALLAGTEFAERRIEADPDHQQRIADAIDAFFTQHVEPRIPPATTDPALLLTFTHPEGTQVADGHLLDLGNALAGASTTKAAALADYDEARDQLARLMASWGVRELIGPDWTAKAGPARKDEPDGKWQVTFRRKRN